MLNTFLTFGDEKAPDAPRTRGLKLLFYENTAACKSAIKCPRHGIVSGLMVIWSCSSCRGVQTYLSMLL